MEPVCDQHDGLVAACEGGVREEHRRQALQRQSGLGAGDALLSRVALQLERCNVDFAQGELGRAQLDL